MIGARELHPAVISVAVPSHDVIPFNFAYDWANLCAFTAANLPDSVVFGNNVISGTYVHSAREDLLSKMLADGVTHVLWLDSDMRFPKDALVRLLQHNVPVVGINYAKRTVPTDYVAIKNMMRGERLVTSESSTGLEEVDALGFGCVLMRTAFLGGLPENEPWFWFERLEDGRMVGEDVYFCRLLRERCDLKLYVDHDLSKECAHIGQFEYHVQHAAAFREVGS